MRIAIRTNSELLLECGYYKPPSVVDLNDKEEIVKAVSLHHVIFKSKAELDQLKDGLQTLGVGSAIKAMPDAFLPLFTADLNAGALLTPGRANGGVVFAKFHLCTCS